MFNPIYLHAIVSYTVPMIFLSQHRLASPFRILLTFAMNLMTKLGATLVHHAKELNLTVFSFSSKTYGPNHLYAKTSNLHVQLKQSPRVLSMLISVMFGMPKDLSTTTFIILNQSHKLIRCSAIYSNCGT